MKKITLTLLIGIAFCSCKKTTKANCDDKDLNCSAVLCITYWQYFEFNLIDKTSGADLIFGSTSRYAVSDVKLFYDAAKTMQINIVADNTNKKLVCMGGREEMYLEIKGTKTYKIVAEYKMESCCNGRVKTLKVDNTSVCTCCDDVIKIGVD